MYRVSMTSSTPYLLLVLLGAIALLIFLINWRTKMHPFLALVIVSITTGLATGVSPTDLPETLTKGAGGVLGETGIVIFLGAMLGRLLADTGAVSKIADLVIDHSTPRAAPWLTAGVSFVIGIPMFFEVGLVVLMPMLFAVALRLEIATGRPRTWYLRVLVPAIAALCCLHGMLPPHPGPVIAVNGLHANMGLTIGLGLICAIPTVILAGPVYAGWISKRIELEPPAALIKQNTGTTPEEAFAKHSGSAMATVGGGSAPHPVVGIARRPVSTGLAFICVLVPVALMLFHTVTDLLVPDSWINDASAFLGNPVIAMLGGVLFASATIALQAGLTGPQVRESFTKSLGTVASVVLIIAGGGTFNAVLQASGIGDAIIKVTTAMDINLVVLGWFVGLLLSFCTGSATVGIVSATGVLAPLVTGLPPTDVSLIVIAIGCGSIGLNWVNHSGFWFVKEAFGMTLGQATKTHMMVQTLVSVIGGTFAWLLSLMI
jgi:H+/gluconate symporter and related permeases